jgi:hypothetical protein
MLAAASTTVGIFTLTSRSKISNGNAGPQGPGPYSRLISDESRRTSWGLMSRWWRRGYRSECRGAHGAEHDKKRTGRFRACADEAGTAGKRKGTMRRGVSDKPGMIHPGRLVQGTSHVMRVSTLVEAGRTHDQPRVAVDRGDHEAGGNERPQRQ